MKIVYIVRSLHPVGGIERTLTDKANWMVAHGHEVMFVTYKQGNDSFYFPLDKRVQLHDLECSTFSMYKYPLYSRMFYYRKLQITFRKRMKTILNEFMPDIVVVAIPNAEDFLWDLIKVAKRTKIIIESHVAFEYFLMGKSLTDRLLYVFFSPLKAIRKADMLIALTEHDAVCWRHHKAKNVQVVPNPVPYYADNDYNIEKEKGRIIVVGRLASQKRFDRLIEAFSLISDRYPGWYIDIFGEGELREDLDSLIKEKGLKGRVNIMNFVHNIYPEYMRSQFLVLSSDFEGFGLVIVEAMACGLPIVSTDCPFGPSDIIDDGKTGLLAKMDVQDLADKMEWMISHEEERLTMGENAYKKAAEFRQEVVMPRWENVYMSLV
jgi:glycosyltransferase involved in cell wall biosynthesis